MNDNEEKLNLLLDKLNEVLKQQESFKSEIDSIKKEIQILKGSEQTKTHPEQKTEAPLPVSPTPTKTVKPTTKVKEPKKKKKKEKSDLEKFIGENLINKIGIAITVLGVGFGAKYAIDHDMISPLTRVILGYIFGLGLLGLSYKLKAKYLNFSAVLLSGAMAILYFITFIAYAYFDLIPQLFAFGLMVVFTAFTVAASINYNQVVIANFGLVGAYAVPFLLSNGSGKVQMLYTYMTVINAGILVLAIKKYWKSLYYSSFFLTWIIYIGWLTVQFEPEEHQWIALIFSFLFYVIFYASFISYKLINNKQFTGDTIWLLIANSFIFYGNGYFIFSEIESLNDYIGLFTLGNALIHFIVGIAVYRKALADKSILYLIIGLVLTFITIAIPVQLDGNWVTLMWGLEAVLLFSIGRIKSLQAYEKLSYPLILLAFFSLGHDWVEQSGYYDPFDESTRLKPILNIHFLSSFLIAICFGIINYIKFQSRWEPPKLNKQLCKLISFIVPAVLIITLFITFKNEISVYWDQKIKDSGIVIVDDLPEYGYNTNLDLIEFKRIWTINYFLFFIAAIALLNWRKIKNTTLGTILFILGVFGSISFLSTGLYSISELRESFLDAETFFPTSGFHVGIRYISLVFFGVFIWSLRMHSRKEILNFDTQLLNNLLLIVSVLWLASSELIHWLDLAGMEETYKLGLSILWGVYSLLLIVFGIWKRQKHVRIIAMVWFLITIIKVFAYDIVHLNSISKTIAFVSLGILLLISSFLYNKYKDQIAGNEKS